MNDQMRKEFEYDAERYGFDITRSGWATSEPWSEYVNLETGHRWAGWRATCESKQKEIDDLDAFNEDYKRTIQKLEAQLREQHQNQLDLMERIPVNPDEVYSPHTEVIR